MRRWGRRRETTSAEVAYNVLEGMPPREGWATRAARGIGRIGARLRDWQPPETNGFGGFGGAATALDWERVRAEVLQDCRMRVRIAGSEGSGKSTLLDHLHSMHGAAPPSPIVGASESLGLFEVVAEHAGGDDVWIEGVAPADLTIWLLDACAGVRRVDVESLARLRSSGRPLIVALNKIDSADAQVNASGAAEAVGSAVIGISAGTGEGVLDRLLPAMVEACPPLATALGREMPAYRTEATRQVIGRAAALSGMSGFDLNPLFDVPDSAAVQMQLVMRIAAVYGHGPTDRYSREMLAVVFAGMLVRGAAGLLLRGMPLVGGVLFQGISAGATYGIGRAATVYFRNGKRWRAQCEEGGDDGNSAADH
jgi:uncharacterized protein (DUF697 family)